ncbi:cellulase family glycosylhydrolase [Actinoplanes sp. NPDC048967]|uniref:glycoside hydrolase family 26 protein n=1 Tax=Actinoplanes sp. NPDC048967 TaxID=3155269 RepID=UPI0033D79FB8
MADERPPRKRLWLGAGAAAIALAATAVGLAQDPRDPVPSASTGPSVSAPPVSAPSASAAPGARSARALIALPRADGTWPGANGMSGVNGDPLFDTAHVNAFCIARGRACRVAQTYTDRTSWAAMTAGSGWTFDLFSDFDGMLVVSQGLVPIGASADLAACAAGEHDQDWKNFGSLMTRYGRGDSVVRLGWEFNEKTSPWRADDPKTWIACYRRAATNIRATNPDVLLDWTINAHGTPAGTCGGVSTNCYPGDEYVDIIGIDNYDHYPWSPTKAVFDQAATDPEGLTWLYDFARQHGKPFSVGEWGVVPTGDAGQENPSFVTWMHEWFAAHASNLAYEAYFSDCGDGGVQSSLFRTDAACVKNPKSAAVYRSLFRS